MGYYTDYELYVRNCNNPDLRKRIWDYINERVPDMFIDDYWDETHKEYSLYPHDTHSWYEHDSDMVAVSGMFPNCVFQLVGKGEDDEDRWKAYYKNGQYEVCACEFVYPKPTLVQWDDD